jgi:ABC-2 type transport system ATP-binding protein
VIEGQGLGKRFGGVWALSDCSITVPAGSLCALLGSNGAGKTTLLRILAGLSRATTGSASIDGVAPGDDRRFLASIGYLAQEIPLYRRWRVVDHIRLGAHLNDQWDDAGVRARLHGLDIPFERKIHALSGGMRAQVALTLALGKRPRVLLLDEPVAALDPLARREFLGILTEAVAAEEVTVLLSSHLLADLERVSDHVIVLSGGRLALSGDIDDVLASHRVLTAPARETDLLERDHEVVRVDRTSRQVSVIARLHGPIAEPGWTVEEAGLEEIVLAYLGRRPVVPERLAS